MLGSSTPAPSTVSKRSLEAATHQSLEYTVTSFAFGQDEDLVQFWGAQLAKFCRNNELELRNKKDLERCNQVFRERRGISDLTLFYPGSSRMACIIRVQWLDSFPKCGHKGEAPPWVEIHPVKSGFPLRGKDGNFDLQSSDCTEFSRRLNRLLFLRLPPCFLEEDVANNEPEWMCHERDRRPEFYWPPV